MRLARSKKTRRIFVMKKALSVFLMIAVAFGAFADEPVADVNVAEFSGNAAVQWGVDLDSGTTGFQNSYEVNLKLNLLNNGSKSTTGDGVWGELVLKVDGDTYAQWQNKTHGDTAFAPTKGMAGETAGGDLTAFFKKVYVDVAKIHIGPVYIGIKSGDTQTGALKMDAAIRSADDDQAKWVNNVGPADYSQGIVLGYDSDMFKVDLDLRSKPNVNKKDEYDIKLIIGIDDKDGDSLISEGDVVYFADNTSMEVTKDNAGEYLGRSVALAKDEVVALKRKVDDSTYYYTDNYAAALEGEFKGVENLSIKAGASYNFAKNYQAQRADKDKTAIGDPEHILGYSASAGYNLGLNDTFYIRPQVGFAGSTGFTTTEIGDKERKESTTSMEMAFGLLFGWGEIGEDKNAGVYYLDDNMAKKVSPGVGVVAHIPFVTISKSTLDGNTTKTKKYGNIAARIMPSFYSGEIVPGLTAAAYADIVIPKTGEGKTEDKLTTTYDKKDRATAMAFTFGAKYAIEAGEVTITPQAGVRFANAAYVAYGIKEKGDAVFGEMGDHELLTGQAALDDKDGIKYDGNFMNLKLGVDVAGLIDNTTLSVIWATDNILNELSDNDANINKLGTLNFKAKIAL